MRTLNFHCRYCGVTNKVILEDVELTADGTVVEGMCNLCFESYQAKGLADPGDQFPDVAFGVHDVQPENAGSARSSSRRSENLHALRNQKGPDASAELRRR